MSTQHTKLLLVTANVGSIFEDPENMQQTWLKEFLAEVERLVPDVVALHCQEVGGKNYEDSMKNVNLFVKSLLASEALQHYDRARIFLDEDFTAVDKFTALGCLYFVHRSVENVQIYDFDAKEFTQLLGKEVLSGNIEHATIKEKAKFPQEFFPNYKWSRKGFIRTRWNISNNVFDLVNIHLFHDASNIVAMETTPSEYCLTRKNALEYTINRFETDEYPKVPYFIFGDFNFRLDTRHIIQELTSKLKEHRCVGKKDELSKVTYTEGSQEKVMLTVEKKGFDHRQHSDVFFNCSHWLKGFDKEFDSFSHKLHECQVTFPPSYPFSEDVNDGRSYMKTRCPSWCDRILYTPSAKSLIVQEDSVTYDMMGKNVCMGDHKPIYLNLKLRPSSGNHDNEDIKPPKQTPISPDLPDIKAKRSRLKKVISVNGEECDPRNINIHDFTTFENEQLMTGGFMTSIRRRSVADGEVVNENMPKRPSFKNVVRNVIRAEQVISRLYNHRSDTEEDSDLDDIRKLPPSQPVTPGVSSDSIQLSDKLQTDNNNDLILNSSSKTSLNQLDNNNMDDPVTLSDLPKETDALLSPDTMLVSVSSHDPNEALSQSVGVSRGSNVSLSSCGVVHGKPSPSEPEEGPASTPKSKKVAVSAARQTCPCCVIL